MIEPPLTSENTDWNFQDYINATSQIPALIGAFVNTQNTYNNEQAAKQALLNAQMQADNKKNLFTMFVIVLALAAIFLFIYLQKTS